jgi:hypothetical protein
VSKNTPKKFDVKKRQNYLFDASVRNTLLANESVKMAQESMLALGLAELAFLGVLLLGKPNCNWAVKPLIIVLTISFLLFLFGQIRQFNHQLRRARGLEYKANIANEYLIEGRRYLENEPENISLESKQIKSDNIANLCILGSLALVLVVTICTTILVITL